MESCDHIDLIDCIVSHNGFGIKTSSCQDIHIDNSTISYNTHAGILNTNESNNITITHCEITKNLRISIYTSHSEIICSENNIYNSICGFFSEEAICYIQNNWWGSRFGPGLIERKQQDNIKEISSIIQVVPWAKQKITDIGASWKIAELFELKFDTRILLKSMAEPNELKTTKETHNTTEILSRVFL